MAHTGYQILDFSGVVFSDTTGRAVTNALEFKNGNIYEIVTNTKKPVLVRNFTYKIGGNEVILPDFFTDANPLLNITASTGAITKFTNGFWGLYFGISKVSANRLYDNTIVITPENKVYLSITGRNI